MSANEPARKRRRRARRVTNTPPVPETKVRNLGPPAPESDTQPPSTTQSRESSQKKTSLARNGEKIIVLCPGSRVLKYGFASDPKPRSIPQIVAIRIKSNVSSDKSITSDENRDFDYDNLVVSEFAQIAAPPDRSSRSQYKEELDELLANRNESWIKLKKVVKGERILQGNKNSFFENANDVAIYTQQQSITRIMDCTSARHFWHDVSPATTRVAGKKATRIRPSEPFQLHYPFSRGHFNLSPGQSWQQVSRLAEDVLREALENDMKLSSSDFSDLSVALALPDQWTDMEITAYSRILLDKIGFKELFVHKESVLSCFGAGLDLGVVVDIGATKTHIACIVGGDVIPGTSQFLTYGGDDVTAAFASLLPLKEFNEERFAWDNMDVKHVQHRQAVEHIKITTGSFPPERVRHDRTATQFDIFTGLESPEPCVIHYCMNLFDISVMAPHIFFDQNLIHPVAAFDQVIARRKYVLAKSYCSIDSDCHLKFLYQSPFYEYSGQYIRQKAKPEVNEVKPAASISPPSVHSTATNHSNFSSKADQSNHVEADSNDTEVAKEHLDDISTDESKSAGSSQSMQLAKGTGSKSKSRGNKNRQKGLTANNIVGLMSFSDMRAMGGINGNIEVPHQQPDYGSPLLQSREDTLSLHEAVTKSILTIRDVEFKRKMAQQILIVGGGARTNGLIDKMEQMLIQTLPYQDPTIDTVNAGIDLKNNDPAHCTWLGLALITCGEACAPMWLSREQFLREGTSGFREVAPFPW